MDVGNTLKLAKRRCDEGRLAEAEALCRDLIAARPDLAEAENLLGVIIAQTGDVAPALEHFNRAIALAPGVAGFKANLSEALRISGQLELAVQAARRAIEIAPDLPVALINLGAAHYELQNYEDAARAYHKAIAASPRFANAHISLGNALTRLGRLEEAVAAYRRAIELDPRAADVWVRLADALNLLGAMSDGVVALRRAVALAPDHIAAHVSLSWFLLARGNFAEGWEEYEWRLRSRGWRQRGLHDASTRPFPERPWRGESLAGRHIYVAGEQGFGDSLQFVRYVVLLVARAATVTLRVRRPLASLLRASLPGVAILTETDEPVPYHCDVALLSLPYLFKTRLETIPAGVPYLRPPTEVATRWRDRLADLQGLKVGLVWAGNSKNDNDVNRSVGLAALTPLLTVADVSFVSLQYGPRAADLQTLGGVVEDLSPELSDFSDTAGVILALDLVVTVDTSVAHLAGALAKPVWVLAPHASDWRWMYEIEDSPWYPTMRLFRQRRGETWGPAVDRLLRELSVVARGDPTPLTPFKAIRERRAAQAADIIAIESERAEKVRGAGRLEG